MFFLRVKLLLLFQSKKLIQKRLTVIYTHFSIFFLSSPTEYNKKNNKSIFFKYDLVLLSKNLNLRL
jgi:intracellular septation protein A